MIKHLHYLFASIIMLALGMNASAQEVVTFAFNEANSYEQFGLAGWSTGNTKDGDITENKTTTAADGTSLTATPSSGNTATRMFKSEYNDNISYSLRIYKDGQIIIKSAKNIESISFTGKIKNNNFAASVGTYANMAWSNDGVATNEVAFTAGQSTTINTVTVTLAGGNVDPTPTEPYDVYSIVFSSQEVVKSWVVEGSQANQDDFTMWNDKSLQINGYIATGRDETNYVVSPKITLDKKGNKVEMNHRALYYFGDPADELNFLCIRTVGGEWTTLPKLYFNDNESSFYSAGEIYIPEEFNGKEVEFGFHYIYDNIKNFGYWYIKDFKVIGGVEVPEPEPTETIAENIAAFNALCVKDGADVTLNLTDAKVLYVNEWEYKGNKNQEVFVKDATGTLMFYNVGLTVKNGDVLNGSIKGIAKDFYGTPEFCSNANTDVTTLTATEGELAEAEVKALNEITNNDISNLVVVENLKMISREKMNKDKLVTNYYLVDENNNELCFNNKFHIDGLFPEAFLDKMALNFKGIIKLDHNVITFCPIEELVNTGIGCIENVELDVNAPMYNVAGQKVNANYKGIVLQNGKKFFNK